MTLQQLEYALMLSKSGSFKKASAKLGISQPGLSLQIQKLEEGVGIILFDRSGTPVSLTPDGEAFMIRAEEIVLNANQLNAYARTLHDNYQGRLSVGIIPTLAPFLVPLFIDPLLLDYPDFELDIQEQTTENVISGIRSGVFDVGIISTPQHAFGINTTPLFYERFYFYTSEKIQSDSISLENLDYNQLWLLNEGNCFRDQINDFCNLNQVQQDRQFLYRSNSIDALVRIVDHKGGVTILPELTLLSLNEQQEEKITPIENKAREIGIIERQQQDKKRFRDKLIQYIQSNIPGHMLRSDGLEIVDPHIQIK